MKNVILNEREILDKALKGEVEKRESDTVGVLIRHYFSLGYDKNEVYELLNEYLTKYKVNYNPDMERKFLKNFIGNIYEGGRFNLVNIKNIPITKKEWDIISSIKDEKTARVAFMLLVHIKIENKKRLNPSNHIVLNLGYILKEASLRGSNNDNVELFSNLVDIGLINVKRMGENRRKGMSLVEIKFVDHNGKDVVRNIETFDKVITYFYELYKGWKYRVCEECRTRFKVANRSKSKLCSTCQKDKTRKSKLSHYHRCK
jgi:hypothetical protein